MLPLQLLSASLGHLRQRRQVRQGDGIAHVKCWSVGGRGWSAMQCSAVQAGKATQYTQDSRRDSLAVAEADDASGAVNLGSQGTPHHQVGQVLLSLQGRGSEQ